MPFSLFLLGEEEEALLAEGCGSAASVRSPSTEVVLQLFITTSGLDDLDLVGLVLALPVTLEEIAGAGLSLQDDAGTLAGEFSISIWIMFFVFAGDIEGSFLCTAEFDRGRDIVTLAGLAHEEATLPVDLPSSETKGTLDGLGCIALTSFWLVFRRASVVIVEVFLLSVLTLLKVNTGGFGASAKPALVFRVGLDLLLAMTRFAGLASTGVMPFVTEEAAAAFAFSRNVVALVLCRTVLLRYRPSGSLADEILRILLLLDDATRGLSESSSSED